MSRALAKCWYFVCLTLIVAAVAGAPAVRADWVNFVDQTSTRIVATSSLVVTDTQEKDYDWADIDKDGDIDLAIVRKQPFTSPGKFRNVLLMNENGVLVDRTTEYASDTDVPGDLGFLTPTNDRDVRFGDLDLDGWLDMVTATTISVGDPKSIGHPRIYRNKGDDANGNWLGFKYEVNRIPTMLTYNGSSGKNPCFCSASLGDVTGDGYPDIYFGDYDSGASGGSNCDAANSDFNDKLLINRGATQPGYFDDFTNTRFIGTVPGPNAPFQVSAFGAANSIADMNNDTLNEIVKQTGLSPPTYVGTAYNNSTNQGTFSQFEANYTSAPYFVSTGDLNNDNKLDMVITDDGGDRYLLNQGNGGDGMANFVSFTFSFTGGAGDDSFGSDSVIVDLNNDGWDDVLIADVDVDIPGCDRRMHIYRNMAGAPGGNVQLKEETTGTNCANFNGNPPSCIVASIPSNKLEGVHDVAVFDINGDGWKDMVVGRCVGTEVYMAVPPGVPVGSVPDGDGVAGDMLLMGRVGSDLSLSWGDSCNIDDTDYGIYEGRLGLWDTHAARVCSTGGATTQTITPFPHDAYYLVVPHNGAVEGSYGLQSSGQQRSPAATAAACFPQNVGACP